MEPSGNNNELRRIGRRFAPWLLKSEIHHEKDPCHRFADVPGRPERRRLRLQGVYGTPYEGPTRAQVQAELAAAKAAGQVSNVEPNDMPFQGVYGAPQSGVTRAQVEAELATAKAAGQVSNVEPNDLPFSGAYHRVN